MIIGAQASGTSSVSDYLKSFAESFDLGVLQGWPKITILKKTKKQMNIIIHLENYIFLK